jgi:hypothetical protein
MQNQDDTITHTADDGDDGGSETLNEQEEQQPRRRRRHRGTKKKRFFTGVLADQKTVPTTVPFISNTVLVYLLHAAIAISAILILIVTSISFIHWILCVSVIVNIYMVVLFLKNNQGTASEKKGFPFVTAEKNTTGTQNNKQSQKLVRFEFDAHKMHETKFDVVCRDAVQWLNEQESLNGFVVTSMPDYTEIERMTLETWKIWFVDTAELILRKLADGNCAVFYQTDVKILESKVLDEHDRCRRTECREWVDKSFLCHLGASRVPGVKLLWHKVMLLSEPESIKTGRPCYTHMVCFGKNKMDKLEKKPLPDVVDRGDMIYSKAMGVNACLLAAMFCKANGAKLVIDPFCGKGSALLAANFVGLDALGVDISQSRCRNAASMKKNSIDSFVTSMQVRSFVNIVDVTKDDD